MKILKEFEVGSNVYFSSFNDFEIKDFDIMRIVDELEDGEVYLYDTFDNFDFFIYKEMTKQEFINYFNFTGFYIQFACFLIPKVAEYLKITIDDLKKLKQQFYSFDENRDYLKMIYDYYIENDGFYLTQNQLENAYQCYKRCSNLE